ncbi:hypothetical protein P8A22_38045 (plasmid) [Streptomyces laculatispora]|uniref:CU044_5270 family protein n=1 Tax=Streptomyces laculatispora TaxID=887464 RepID=A0ABY9IHC9_9ACTN|nr:hypothetical protein [Streptomyces laculatispora]WLQ45629.1 hypothetical protein P8A22_38045 [Streptomyces laculatispora]
MREIENCLKNLNPADSVATPDEAELQRILSSERKFASPGRYTLTVRRRWALAGAGVLVVAGGLMVTKLGGVAPQPAIAVTPAALRYEASDCSASAMLRETAERTEKLREARHPDATHRFVQDSWFLSTRIDGIQVTSAVIPEHRETWVSPDGSQKWKARTQEPQFQTDKQRKEWQDSGALGDTPKTFSGSSGPAGSSDPPPAGAEGMRDWIARGLPRYGSGEMFGRIREAYLDHSFSPKQRAAILHVIGSASDVSCRGEVVDRAGRAGVGYSVNSAYRGLDTRYTLVFDPKNGVLLSYEEELRGSAGALNVKTPAVISYVTYMVH